MDNLGHEFCPSASNIDFRTTPFRLPRPLGRARRCRCESVRDGAGAGAASPGELTAVPVRPIRRTRQALEKYNIEKDIAAYIKKEFDKKYNPTWHAIVGRNFGSYVTHETKHFIYFYLGQVAVLLFKSG